MPLSRLALPLPAAVLAVLAALPADAGVGTGPRPALRPGVDVLLVCGFDPRRGELLAARVVIEAHARAEIAVENVGALPQIVHASSTMLLQVRLPDGQVLASLPFDGTGQWALAAFDGALDYQGASGGTATFAGRRRAEVVLEDPAQLLAFLASPGSAGNVELTAASTGAVQVVGGDALSHATELEAAVRVRVEYAFKPFG